MIDYCLEELLEKFKAVDPRAPRILAMVAHSSGKSLNQVILEKLNLDEEEEKKFREKYPSLFLSQLQIKKLQEIIANNKLYKQHVQFKDIYRLEDEEKLLKELAKKIYDSLKSETDKKQFTPADIYGTLRYIPIMNLGVVETLLQNRAREFKEYMREYISFFKENKEIGARLLLNYFMKKGETLYNGDLDKFIQDTKQELREIGAFKK
jgi:hypothetical protein